MQVTIAIPTHNRAGQLHQTLSSLSRLELSPDLEVEGLVIDNASTDGTPAVIDSWAADAPFRLRRIAEPRVGSSYARNRAIMEARGEFIFFIDDDVIVEPRWAASLLAALQGETLDAACGLVVAEFLAPPPPWLGVELYCKLAVHDRTRLAAEPAERVRLSNLFSANVGFRRECFGRFGRFREDLGVVGGNPLSGEDTELFERIMRGGGRLGFAPEAVVHHLIGPERLSRAYFRRKSFAFGVGSAMRGGASHNHLDKLIRNTVRMATARLRGRRAQAFHHQLECINFCGYWYGRLGRKHPVVK